VAGCGPAVRALDRKLLRDLARMRWQALTIALVVAAGVASFVAAVTTHRSLARSQETYYAAARFADVFAHLKRAPVALERRIGELPGVGAVESRIVHEVTLDVAGLAEPATGRMVSLPGHGTQPLLNQLHVRRGRLIDPAHHADEVLVSEGFATKRGLAPGDRLVAIINGRRQELHIVGVALSPEFVYAVRGGEVIPDDEHFGVLWMARTSLAAAFDMEGAFNDVVLRLAPGASVQAVLDDLDRLLEPYGGLGAYGRDDQVSHRLITGELKEQRALAITLPPVLLGVGAFLLNVALGRLVATQRGQIAALKALGYGNRPIALHYLEFVLAVVAGGIVLGTALGAWLGRAMTRTYSDTFFHFPALAYAFEPWVPLVAGAVSLAAGALGALTAVRRAVALPPAEAMRPEAPPSYQATLVERLGLARLLGPKGRMVARSMARRPLRALLTALGVAFAVTLLVAGLFWFDAFDYIMDVQFRLVQREDATVVFTAPVPMRARSEIAHLAGARYADGLRSVPVRLRAGNRTYRTALVGLAPDAQLKRLLDADLHAVPVPPDGVLLTTRLGERLGVGAGDALVVEILEGRRSRREVRVAGLIDELIGISAYMDLEAVNRLVGEGRALTEALVAFDADHAESLLAALKALPHVASVTAKRSALRTFDETLARFLLVYAGVITAFATVIAFGVVYNSGRIVLSEREREIASLCVLGFTRREVLALLLGELGLELAAGIPAGMLLGYLFAWGSSAMIQMEELRVPVVVAPRTYAYATLVVVLSAVVCAGIIRRHLDRLDPVTALKTPE